MTKSLSRNVRYRNTVREGTSKTTDL